MPSRFHLMFQDSMSPLMEQLNFFHDHVLLVVIMIMSLVTYMFFMFLTNHYINRYLLDNQELEAWWTAFPGIILIFIALPSLHLLYMMDEVNSPSITLKAIGHQWYWSYEYSDFKEINFDSFMVTSNENMNLFRLLDTDNRIIMPTMIQIRILVTSADVIHSWAIPSLGCKVDAVPGRLNQTSLMIIHPAVMYGQCSEICGANHSFMPIVLEAIPANKFIEWMNKF